MDIYHEARQIAKLPGPLLLGISLGRDSACMLDLFFGVLKLPVSKFVIYHYAAYLEMLPYSHVMGVIPHYILRTREWRTYSHVMGVILAPVSTTLVPVAYSHVMGVILLQRASCAMLSTYSHVMGVIP